MWNFHFISQSVNTYSKVCCGHKGRVEEIWTEKEKENEGPLIQEPQGPQLNV